MKIYKCYKCGKVLDYKPTRFVKQKYGAGRFNQFYPVKFYDLCDRCCEILIRWLDNIRKK